jgi:hypothetical protein
MRMDGSCGMLRRACRLVVLLMCLPVLLSGCESDVPEAAHEIPAHKPAGFVEGVDALEQRAVSAAEWTDQQRQEFQEIVDWLPELAAQTDLVKAEWDRVQAETIRLQEILGASPADMTPAALEASLQELRKLAVRAEEVEQNPVKKPEVTTENPDDV